MNEARQGGKRVKRLVYLGGLDPLGRGLLERLEARGYSAFHFAPEGGELYGEGAAVDYADPDSWRAAADGLGPTRLPDLVLLAPPWRRRQAFLESREQDWQEALSLNVEAAVYGLQALTRRMVEVSKPGHVIALLHVAGLKPYRSLSAYGTSLSALEALLRMVAVELAPFGISVNSVAAGFSSAGPLELEDSALALLERDTPRGELVGPDEVARVIESLLATGTELTGQVIRCDGGHLLTRGRPGPAPFAEQ